MRTIMRFAFASLLLVGCQAPRDAHFEISAHVVDAAGNPARGQRVNLEAVIFTPGASELEWAGKDQFTADDEGNCGPFRFSTTVQSGGYVDGHATVPNTDVSGQVRITYDDVGEDDPTLARTIELKLP